MTEGAVIGAVGHGVNKYASLKSNSKALKQGKNVFPENPDDLLPELPRSKVSATGQTINTSDRVRIRAEKHPIKPGETYNPRHHGTHYHVEYRIDTSKSWNNKRNVSKIYPNGYTPGGGTGFLPGETFPGSRPRRWFFISVIYDLPLNDAFINKVEIMEDYIIIYIELYNAKVIKIKFINYYKIIDNCSIGKEIGDFTIKKSSNLVKQTIYEEIESGASKKYMDEIEINHFILFEAWERKKIMEIVYEKMEIEYL